MDRDHAQRQAHPGASRIIADGKVSVHDLWRRPQRPSPEPARRGGAGRMPTSPCTPTWAPSGTGCPTGTGHAPCDIHLPCNPRETVKLKRKPNGWTAGMQLRLLRAPPCRPWETRQCPTSAGCRVPGAVWTPSGTPAPLRATPEAAVQGAPPPQPRHPYLLHPTPWKTAPIAARLDFRHSRCTVTLMRSTMQVGMRF